MTQVVPPGRLYISPVIDRRYSAAPSLPYTVCGLPVCSMLTAGIFFPVGRGGG
jgi:hypothetical protein